MRGQLRRVSGVYNEVQTYALGGSVRDGMKAGFTAYASQLRLVILESKVG